MPLVSSELGSQYYEPVARGPAAQLDLSNAIGVPATIVAAGNFTSAVLNGDGFGPLAVAVTSTQAGALVVTRYLDTLGMIIQASLSTPIVATTPLVVNVGLETSNPTDNLPYRSFKVQITNTGGSTATITGFALLLIAQ